jgi:hypothetical protein
VITPKAQTLVQVRTLRGFFEAPWLFKRKGTYYMIYAGNNAAPNSPCTPTSYHACQAWGTAPSPLGPWTYRGVLLDLVSSTTSHSGAVEFKGQWYLAYHTADAEGSTHFRRSVAIDKLEFDDSTSPPAIKKVQQTHRPKMAIGPNRNIALQAKAAASSPVPIQYWIRAVNDGKIPAAPLPPDYWSSYNGDKSPQSSVITLTWNRPVTINGTAVAFFADQPAGRNVGVPPPANYHIEYQNGGAWTRIDAKYSTRVSNTPDEVHFAPVKAGAVKAVFTASGGGGKFGGVGVKEWMVFGS